MPPRHEDARRGARAQSSRPGTSCARKDGVAAERRLGRLGEDGRARRGCAGRRAPSTPTTRHAPSAPRRQCICQRPTRSRAPRVLRPCPTRSKRTVVRASGASARAPRSIRVIRNSAVWIDRSRSTSAASSLREGASRSQVELRRQRRGRRKISSCGLLPSDDFVAPASARPPLNSGASSHSAASAARPGRCAQARAQLLEARRPDLLGVLLLRERVGAGVEVLQDRFERRRARATSDGSGTSGDGVAASVTPRQADEQERRRVGRQASRRRSRPSEAIKCLRHSEPRGGWTSSLPVTSSDSTLVSQ